MFCLINFAQDCPMPAGVRVCGCDGWFFIATFLFSYKIDLNERLLYFRRTSKINQGNFSLLL